MRRQVTVLVTDGDERPALAITRSLGRRGVRVVVAAQRDSSLAGASRFCARRVICPSPYVDPSGFERRLLEYLERRTIDVLLPVTDVTTAIVAGNREEFSARTRLALPASGAFDAVTDKARLVEHAASVGVPVPRTIVVRGADSLEGVLGRVEYPAVVKPFRSRIPARGGWIGTRVHYAEDARALAGLYRSIDYLRSYPSLLQERVAGSGVGLFTLFDRGRMLAAFAHRRLREKPPSGGVSVFRESVRPDELLVDYTRRLLEPLAWHGPAMVEFKRAGERGLPYLMEVNGRFWGSLQLAIDAGVDFPLLTCQLALGQKVEPPPGYRVGVRSRWLLGDLDHLLLRLLRSDQALSLASGSPSRLQTLREFLSLRKCDLNFEVLRRDDPWPFFREVADYAQSAVRSLRRATGSVPVKTARVPPAAEEYPHAGPVR